MLRFTPPTTRVSHKARWPDVERSQRRTPFSRRPDLESLSVVIDSELIDGLDESEPTRELLLAGLLSHDFVQLRRYSDNGPPADAPRRSNHRSTGAAEGWLVVTGCESEPPPQWGVLSVDGDSMFETAVVGDIPPTAARDNLNECYAELGAEEAAEQRQRDVIAAEGAAAIDADMFITQRPYLYATRLPVADGVMIATIPQALPVVSLYLRAQDEFIGWRSAGGHFTAPLTRGTFYSRAAVELVPRGWTVLRALAQHAQGGGDRRMLDLARAVFGRLRQTLVARDGMYWALNRPQDIDAANEALRAGFITLLGSASRWWRIRG